MPWASGRLEVCRIEIAFLVLWLDGSLIQDGKGLSCGLTRRRRCPPPRGGGHAARFYDTPSTQGRVCVRLVGGQSQARGYLCCDTAGPVGCAREGSPLSLTNDGQDNPLFLCHTHNTHTHTPASSLAAARVGLSMLGSNDVKSCEGRACRDGSRRGAILVTLVLGVGHV